MRRVDELLLLAVDGELSERGARELQALIDADAVTWAYVRQYLDVEAALRGMDESFDVTDVVMERIAPAHRGGRRPRVFGKRWFRLAAAALLLFAASTALFLTAQWRRARTDLELTVVEVAGKGPLDAGMILKPGAQLSTRERSRTKLQFLDGTHIELGERTHIRLDNVSLLRSGKTLRLEAGSMVADVAPQSESRPFAVVTPHAELSVRGTRFGLRTDRHQTVLRVFDGGVEFRTASETRMVTAGRQATAGDSDLVVLYTFDEGDGNTVHDWSGFGKPLDLSMTDADAVRWMPDHLLTVRPTILVSDGPASKVLTAVQRSGEFTIEALVQSNEIPPDRRRRSPKRIMSISSGQSDVNVQLGQGSMETGAPDVYECRVLTSRARKGGAGPWYSLVTGAGTVEQKPVQIALTREKSGRTRVYLDGVPVAEKTTPGDFSSWNPASPLILANETATDRYHDRYWLGAYYRVAVYNRALSESELRNLLETQAQGEKTE